MWAVHPGVPGELNPSVLLVRQRGTRNCGELVQAELWFSDTQRPFFFCPSSDAEFAASLRFQTDRQRHVDDTLADASRPSRTTFAPGAYLGRLVGLLPSLSAADTPLRVIFARAPLQTRLRFRLRLRLLHHLLCLLSQHKDALVEVCLFENHETHRCFFGTVFKYVLCAESFSKDQRQIKKRLRQDSTVPFCSLVDRTSFDG